MERQRLFFLVVIGGLLLAVAIFGVVLLVQGDETDPGENSEPEDRGAQVSRVISTETSMALVAAPL